MAHKSTELKKEATIQNLKPRFLIVYSNKAYVPLSADNATLLLVAGSPNRPLHRGYRPNHSGVFCYSRRPNKARKGVQSTTVFNLLTVVTTSAADGSNGMVWPLFPKIYCPMLPLFIVRGAINAWTNAEFVAEIDRPALRSSLWLVLVRRFVSPLFVCWPLLRGTKFMPRLMQPELGTSWSKKPRLSAWSKQVVATGLLSILTLGDGQSGALIGSINRRGVTRPRFRCPTHDLCHWREPTERWLRSWELSCPSMDLIAIQIVVRNDSDGSSGMLFER